MARKRENWRGGKEGGRQEKRKEGRKDPVPVSESREHNLAEVVVVSLEPGGVLLNTMNANGEGTDMIAVGVEGKGYESRRNKQ